ncbi:MAG TPA: porin [Polyangia bacterium]|jgi:hypothetical protein
MVSRSAVILVSLALALAAPALAEGPASQPYGTMGGAEAGNVPKPEKPGHGPGHGMQPLAGWSDQTAFLRSPDNLFQLFPNGRLQVDFYAFKRPTDKLPNDTFALKRARLELFGWIGPWFGFNLAGDFAAGAPAGANPAAQTNLDTTDDFVLVAPLRGRAKDALLFQLGQFDAPFTLENRTSDKYFDFIERSYTVRSFGIPSNKEVGLMVHGLLPNQLVYYSLGVFNGDGQNFKNVDNRFDLIGRAWVAPFALMQRSPLDQITVGGSFWIGDRKDALPLPAQSTVGGFKFFDPKWTVGTTDIELHQNGDVRGYAFELDAPVAHRYGVRFEYVYKDQKLGEYDAAAAAKGKMTSLGSARLKGYSLYGQAWAWVLGDDTIVGRPGLQLPPRFERFGVKAPRHGLQLLARLEHLDEEITSDTAANANPLAGHTTLTSLQLGATYWYTKRFRAMVNYDLNAFGGSADGAPTPMTVTTWSKLNWNHFEHELLVRLAFAL